MNKAKQLHAYKSTPFGLERVNGHPLTIAEAKAMLRANPSLTVRDAQSASYEVLHMPIDWQDEEPTEREMSIAGNFKAGIIIALVASVALFFAELLTR
jgi:hypothetical protein